MKSNEIMPQFAELVRRRDELNHQRKILNRLDQSIRINHQEINRQQAALNSADYLFGNCQAYADYYQLLEKDQQLVTRYNRLLDTINPRWQRLITDMQQVTRELKQMQSAHESVDYSKASPEQKQLILEAFSEVS